MEVPRLPNDDKGRYWRTGEWTDNPELVRSAFITLLSLDLEKRPQVLGHGFVVCASGKDAICLGAAHSFEAEKSVQLIRKGKNELVVPSVFHAQGPQYIESDGIGALVQVGAQGFFCKVTALNYVNGNDVAVFTLRAPHERKIFDAHLSLDFAIPEIGQEVAVLANDINLESKQLDASRHSGKLTQQFGVRTGVVTEVVMGPSAYSNLSYFFRTTIPVTPGMSGAPVLKMPTQGDAVTVLGIVSSDFSDEDSRTNFMVPGCSAISLPLPGMGLALPLRLPGQDKSSYHFLGELLEQEYLSADPANAVVHVRSVGPRTEVRYLDNRDGTVHVLEIAGHPERSES